MINILQHNFITQTILLIKKTNKMKKLLFSVAMLAMVAVSCDKNDDEGVGYTLKVLTFEDADYKAGVNYTGASSWSSLIADPEYYSELLYNCNLSSYICESEYEWCDANNTELRGEVYEDATYGRSFMSGGIVVSNYYKEVVSGTAVDWNNELSVSNGSVGAAGNNGSANFAVVMDAVAGGMGTESTYLSFGDNTARTIDHLYISSTSYYESVALDSNTSSPKLGDDSYFYVTATGYDADDNGTGSVTYKLAEDGVMVSGWNKWDLSSLGDVVRVKFRITSDVTNGYGMSLPAYFAIDDVAVIFE